MLISNLEVCHSRSCSRKDFFLGDSVLTQLVNDRKETVLYDFEPTLFLPGDVTSRTDSTHRKPTALLWSQQDQSKYTTKLLGSAHVPIRDAVGTSSQPVLPSPIMCQEEERSYVCKTAPPMPKDTCF